MYDKISDLVSQARHGSTLSLCCDFQQVQSSMEKEDILKQFDMMTIRQTKIIIDSQAIDVKLGKQSQHMDRTLAEVRDLREQLRQFRDDLGLKVQTNWEKFQDAAHEQNKRHSEFENHVLLCEQTIKKTYNRIEEVN